MPDSVVMNGGIRRKAIQNACHAPISAPSKSISTTAAPYRNLHCFHQDTADRAYEADNGTHGKVDVAAC